MRSAGYKIESPDIPKSLGGWSVVAVLGKGGFGEVYKVEKKEKEGIIETAALKVVSVNSKDCIDYSAQTAEMTTEAIRRKCCEKKDRLLNEVRSMYELRGHSNVVFIRGFDAQQKSDSIGWDIYILMELLTPLDKYLKENTLSVDDVLRVGRDICSAIESCEQKSIIHRDIKTSNIFVTCDKAFKLGDFGVAKVINDGQNQPKTMIGTPVYMAPEIVSGNSYDNRVDIYSLGKVLKALLKGNCDDLYVLNSATSYKVKGLQKIIEKATAENPDDRYRRAADMKKAITDLNLRNYEAEEEKVAVREPEKKAEKEKKRKSAKTKVTVIAVAVMLVAVIVGSVICYFSSPVYKAYNCFDNGDYRVAVSVYDESIKNNPVYKALFAKRMNSCADEIVTAYLDGELDYDTAIEALETLDYMGIVNISDIKELEIYESDKALMQSAEERYESKDYVGAMDKYSKISVNSPYYSDAVKGMQKAFDANVEEISSSIYSYVDQSYYSYAFDSINKAYENIPEAVDASSLDDIKKDVSEKHYEHISSAVDEYIQNNSFASAFSEIEKALSYDDSDELNSLKSDTEVLYEEYVSALVKSCFDTGDMKKAQEEVNNALELVPDSVVLKELETQINESPQALLDVCKAYDYNNYSEYRDGSFISMSSKEYTNGFTLTGSIEDTYTCFNLNKSYSKLKFIFGHKDFSDMNDGVLRIYGDGVLLKEVSATAAALPSQVEVDVENVSVLRIELEVKWAAVYGLSKVTVE